MNSVDAQAVLNEAVECYIANNPGKKKLAEFALSSVAKQHREAPIMLQEGAERLERAEKVIMIMAVALNSSLPACP